jgi:hypothetical protein
MDRTIRRLAALRGVAEAALHARAAALGGAVRTDDAGIVVVWGGERHAAEFGTPGRAPRPVLAPAAAQAARDVAEHLAQHLGER